MGRILKSVLVLITCFTIYFIFRYKINKHGPSNRNSESTKIVVSTAVCENRLKEALNSIKSMLIFSKSPLHLVIFVDDKGRPQLKETLTRWQHITANQFQFELHNISFPRFQFDYWVNLFGKCSAQRLFFPNLLPHIDALIYADADTLFLGPVKELWDQFNQFNETHITALAAEDNNDKTAWYPLSAHHPYYGKYGLNAGVMLMNLTRMRKFGWEKYLPRVVSVWKKNIPWGDQDIVNIILAIHPSVVLELDCRYNFRFDQCLYGPRCAGVDARGVFLLHGGRRTFHVTWIPSPAFPAIYKMMAEYQLGSDPSKTLLSRLEQYMSIAPPLACGSLKQAFLRVPVNTLKTLYPGLRLSGRQ